MFLRILVTKPAKPAVAEFDRDIAVITFVTSSSVLNSKGEHTLFARPLDKYFRAARQISRLRHRKPTDSASCRQRASTNKPALRADEHLAHLMRLLPVMNSSQRFVTWNARITTVRSTPASASDSQRSSHMPVFAVPGRTRTVRLRRSGIAAPF